MYYQQGNTEMGAHQDGLQTLYLMNPNNNYISYTAADTQSQFMGNIIPQSQQDHDHHHQHSINNIQQHSSLWGLAAADQQQTPKGLSLSLGDDDPSVFQGRLMINDDHEVDVKSSVIMGSKYLKAAQELLDEVVSVVVVDKQAKPTKTMITKEVDDHNNNKNNCGPQLTSAQRQEFLIKKTKLNSMLDEVEQRYKQYQQQMQMMVTSFQQVAGNGSAKTYTQLALKTILKQFRCLKNTISSQIKALCKTLGEEDGEDEEYRNSRLKFVDHDHLRQQRTLQQLGMMQNNNNNNNNNNNSAWRPQRGLPEPAVSVLRAWLFEHFLHPYPKDSDKHTLAKQTGLTRSQVSNWFINARVRLWKPMVEDMYLEEIKNQETVPGDDTTKHGPHTSESNSKPSNPRQANNKPEISASTVITKSPTRNYTDYPNNNNPKKPRNENSPRSMLSVDMESDRTIISKGFNDNITLISANPGQNMENYLSSSGFSDGYGISVGGSGFQGNNININSNSNNNNFSLTLALPPSGNYSQGTQLQNFRNFEFGTRIEPVVESNDRVDHGINNRPDGSHPNNGHYEILDFQNRKLPFSSRLIPDHHFLT